MSEDRISRYFGDHAVDWGKHYQGTTVSRRIFNRIFRRALKQRWDLTMEYALPADDKVFLDIGCGTGVYSVALAQAGAAQITGIDFAQPMVDLSRRLAIEHGLAKRCNFIVGDFMRMDFDREFDMVIAMGVFDYINDYEFFWRKMISASKGIVVGSFPRHSTLREPVRRFRYRRKGLPVYFYGYDQVESLGRSAGLKRYEIKVLGAGFILFGFVE